jgi:VIT1/CCC1 family predicted Fe2+/Mn2+ transporter
VPLVGHLNPDESLGEILAGLIMVLTFTLAAGVVTRGGQEGVRTLLFAAVGCNVAWGIIDAVFYILTNAFVRSRRARLIRAISAAPDEVAALATIRRELDPDLQAITRPEDREQLYRSIHILLANGKPLRTGVTRDDLLGALAVFCLVLATTLPAALPFLVIGDPWLALRISNLLLISLLFIVGFHWAQYINANPWLAGLALTGLGLALVAVAIALGG